MQGSAHPGLVLSTTSAPGLSVVSMSPWAMFALPEFLSARRSLCEEWLSFAAMSLVRILPFHTSVGMLVGLSTRRLRRDVVRSEQRALRCRRHARVEDGVVNLASAQLPMESQDRTSLGLLLSRIVNSR